MKDGEACAIWDSSGRHTQVIGPKRVSLFFATIRFLDRYKAESHQYIKVQHRNGKVEHIYGPASIYEDPALHDAVSVHDGIRLVSDHECIIVRKEKASVGASSEIEVASNLKVGKDSVAPHVQQVDVQQSQDGLSGQNSLVRVIRGPALFLPSEDERVHEFQWSGHVSSDGVTLTGIEGDHAFQILPTDTTRIWKLELPLTTSDSVQFRASLIFNYHLVSLNDCITARDPIQRMHAGIIADAQVFGNTIESNQLRSVRQAAVMTSLTLLDTYPNLVIAAKTSGFMIDSVRITGLSYSSSFQRQLDEEQQTSARLSAALEDKTNKSKLYDLELEQRRRQMDQETELKQMEDSAKINAEVENKTKRYELQKLEIEERRRKIDHDAELRRKEMEVNAELEEQSHSQIEAALERRIALARKENEEKKQKRQDEDASVIHFLKALAETGVDMTKFMCTISGMQIARQVLSRSSVLRLPPESTSQRQKTVAIGAGQDETQEINVNRGKEAISFPCDFE